MRVGPGPVGDAIPGAGAAGEGERGDRTAAAASDRPGPPTADHRPPKRSASRRWLNRSTFTFHASRFTLHVSRFTFHASRFTFRAVRPASPADGRLCGAPDRGRAAQLPGAGRRLWAGPTARAKP